MMWEEVATEKSLALVLVVCHVVGGWLLVATDENEPKKQTGPTHSKAANVRHRHTNPKKQSDNSILRTRGGPLASHSTASRPRAGRHSSGSAKRNVALSAVVSEGSSPSPFPPSPPSTKAAPAGGRMALTLSVMAVSVVRLRAVTGGGSGWWWCPCVSVGRGWWLGRRLSLRMA